jgi:hypothetical protein
MNKFDKQHQLNVRKYQRRIDAIYKKTAEEAARRAATLPVPDDYIFTFDDFPAVKKQIDALMATMAADIELTVSDGVRAEWDLSNAKNDALVESVLGDAASLARYHRTHEDALNAFLERKQNGLGLSDRVWRYTDQFKDEIEMGLDLGIREGKDAASIARSIQQYLQYPDMLFRRVKDEHGVFQLSQRAAAFHPGQGVYRSSYKNALRLAATETNIAYRTADHERWQDLDFIVGIEVHLSNNHTVLNHKKERVALFDICDELQGRYPREFKFVGWHPNCRCIATQVFKTDKEMAEDDERLKRGEEPLDPHQSENAVTEMPEGFNKWMEDNAERLESAKSMPYFIRDNFTDGDVEKGLRWMSDKPKRTPEEIADIRERWYTRQALNLYDALGDNLPLSSEGGIDAIFNSLRKHDYDDAERRISLLKAAIRRHAARTAEQSAAITRAWIERSTVADNLGTIIKAAEGMNIGEREVSLLGKLPSSEDVIQHICGGDKTRGSCSSQAFAYIGRRGGLDVSDYRGGTSRDFFANRANITNIARQTGGIVEQNVSDFESAKKLLSNVIEGREYYFGIAEHASVVRKVGNTIEYLELQSPLSGKLGNGWKPLDDKTLKWRFKAKRSRSVFGSKFGLDAVLIDASKLQNDKGYRKLLGYINTDAAKQMKGAGGSIK